VSIADQTFKRIEIIVMVDNAGISDNELNIKSILENQLRILRHPNLSYSAAVNKGIKEACGKYLCCLDSGDTIQPTYLEKCLYRMETEGMDICGSYWQDSDDGDSTIHPVSFKLEALVQANTINRSTVFTKALWKKVGGFYEKLKGRSVSVPSDIQVTHPFVNLASIRGFDSNKIRVLLAMPFLTLGGAEKVVSQICGHLSEHRFHFTLVTTLPWDSQVGDTTAWFEPATTDIFHLPRFLPEKSWKDFVFYLIVSRMIQLIWQVGSSYLYELMPEIKSSFPHIKIADLLFNEIGHTQSNRKYNYCIDLNITENRIVRQWLLDHGEAMDRVVCVPSGVNLAEFYPLTNKSLSCLSLSDGEGIFVVGFFGRFAEEKCPEVFVEIANQLRNEKNLRFIMTGGGPLVKPILSRIEHLDLNSRIQFFGIVHDIRPYLGSCDVLILPSKLDGRPTAVLQALAMGVPVIASNVGSLSEIISNGENGFLCEPGDVDGFVYSIRQLLADPSLHRDLQQKARAYAASFLDAKQWFEGMENAFLQLVSADKNDDEKLTHDKRLFIQ
jgi:glycosyltransferase involved in cell wall biosynthesis